MLRSGLLMSNTYKTQNYNSAVPIKIWPSCFELINILGHNYNKLLSQKDSDFHRNTFY